MGALVAVNVPLAGSYSSAVFTKADPLFPPAISTFPLGSSVAVWPRRTEVIVAVALKEGSTTSGYASRSELIVRRILRG